MAISVQHKEEIVDRLKEVCEKQLAANGYKEERPKKLPEGIVDHLNVWLEFLYQQCPRVS